MSMNSITNGMKSSDSLERNGKVVGLTLPRAKGLLQINDNELFIERVDLKNENKLYFD